MTRQVGGGEEGREKRGIRREEKRQRGKDIGIGRAEEIREIGREERRKEGDSEGGRKEGDMKGGKKKRDR